MATVRTYSDLDLDFLAHPVTRDVVKKLNDESIRRSVRNLLLTNPHDKKFHPEIGTGITELLFEPLNVFTASAIRSNIIETIENHEPRVDIEELEVDPDFDNNGFNVFLLVSIQNLLNPVEIRIFMEKLR